MSGWTILTVRGRISEDYEYVKHNDMDPFSATADIVATMERDDRIRLWTTWSGHVYAYLNGKRYAWGLAEDLLEDYQDMVSDAVVLGANDTTDTGEARYYDKNLKCIDSYEETHGKDGTNVGEVALAHMTANHGIVARDPFHNSCGSLDDKYLNDGTTRIEYRTIGEY